MVISIGKARRLANRILREHRKGRSYRKIAREDYPGVKPGTLNRFAKGKGAYIPKDRDILIALGLMRERKPRVPSPIQMQIHNMAEGVKQALNWKTGMDYD